MANRRNYWEIPELWRGRTVALLGGGPSLTQAQVDLLRGRCGVIAINNAYELAPWADLLYFCDEKWWRWHHEKPGYKAFAGIKVTLENPKVIAAEPAVKSVQNLGRNGLCEFRHGLHTGKNGGYQAIDLAVHLGAKRILLLGYDMRPAEDGRLQWHKGHPIKGNPRQYEEHMLPMFPSLVQPLAKRGVEVLNCTPKSALKVFPMVALEVALGIEAPQQLAMETAA